MEERRTNKQGLGLALSVRREKFFALYWHSVLLCSHERVLEQNSHTATQNADSFSRAHRPNLWVHRSQLLAQLPPFSDRRLFLTVTPSLFFVDCPGTLPFLIFFRSRRKSRAQALCVGFAPKQAKESSDWLSPAPSPTETNAPPSCHNSTNQIWFNLKTLCDVLTNLIPHPACRASSDHH